MNKRPVSYLQTDPRWKALPYQVPGETATIGGSGCGPTAAAMLVETLTGKTFTPVDACRWSVAHGYKAKGQGTYYSYFAPQFEAFGIKCWQLSWTNVYHNPASKVHDQALEYLKQGYYLDQRGPLHRGLVGGRENPHQRSGQHQGQPGERRHQHLPQ